MIDNDDKGPRGFQEEMIDAQIEEQNKRDSRRFTIYLAVAVALVVLAVWLLV